MNKSLRIYRSVIHLPDGTTRTPSLTLAKHRQDPESIPRTVRVPSLVVDYGDVACFDARKRVRHHHSVTVDDKPLLSRESFESGADF